MPIRASTTESDRKIKVSLARRGRLCRPRAGQKSHSVVRTSGIETRNKLRQELLYKQGKGLHMSAKLVKSPQRWSRPKSSCKSQQVRAINQQMHLRDKVYWQKREVRTTITEPMTPAGMDRNKRTGVGTGISRGRGPRTAKGLTVLAWQVSAVWLKS